MSSGERGLPDEGAMVPLTRRGDGGAGDEDDVGCALGCGGGEDGVERGGAAGEGGGLGLGGGVELVDELREVLREGCFVRGHPGSARVV